MTSFTREFVRGRQTEVLTQAIVVCEGDFCSDSLTYMCISVFFDLFYCTFDSDLQDLSNFELVGPFPLR
jgi:hypothetical protein